MIATKQYQESLRSIPAPGAGCHPYLMRVANLGVHAGVECGQIASDIRAAIPWGSRHVPDREIWDTVEKAQREAERNGSFYAVVQGKIARHGCRASHRVSVPQFDADGLRTLVMANGSSDEADLWEASPVRLSGLPEEDAVLLLRHLYQPDDILFLGNTYDRDVKPVEEWISHIERYGTAELPHIIPNPLDGHEHELASGKTSRRCDAAIQKFRFATVEFDNMDREDQLRFWSGVIRLGLLKVVCLIDSGGKSIHAWVQVDAPNRQTWETDIERNLFSNWLVPCGVDRACRNESRLSRLPGHQRHETGNWQRLLWLF